MDTLVRKIVIFFFMVGLFSLLSFFADLIIPLVFAGLMAMLFQPIVLYMAKNKYTKVLIVPSITIITAAIGMIIFLILSASMGGFISESDYLYDRLNTKLFFVFQELSLWIQSITGSKVELSTIALSMLSAGNIQSIANYLVTSTTHYLTAFFMFLFYFVIFLYTLPEYKSYLLYVGGDSRGKTLISAYEKIQKTVQSYVVMKTIIAFATGFLVWLTCIIMDVQFAFLWGFIVFILDFIPFIGSLFAILLPTAMGFVVFDSTGTLFVFFLILFAIQQITGNILEPVLMGNQLNLNTITAMAGLVFWGSIWGVAGMLLAIPLLVVLKMIFEETEDLSFLGRLMGGPKDVVKKIVF